MKRTDRERIEKAVEDLLRRNEIKSAPVDLEKIARRERIAVIRARLPKDVSGFLFRDDTDNVIGVNDKHPEVRQRFTVAHELGHLYLGHSKDQVHVDRNSSFTVKLRDDNATTGQHPEEVQANNFAAMLLMPRTFILKDMTTTHSDVSDDEYITHLAKKYKVSLQALTIRLSSLGFSISF